MLQPLLPDAAIASLARPQHGVVALWQLIALGLTHDEVFDRERSGHLHRIYRAVYAVGRTRITREARWMAATLACGESAALSHRSAATLLRLRRPLAGGIHVSVQRRGGRTDRRSGEVRDDLRVEGLVIHRPPSLRPADVVDVDVIRCTSVPRTILDVAATADRRELERLLDEAAYLEVLSPQALEEVIGSVSRPRGVRLLRSVLAEHDAGSTRTQSRLEERYLAICVEHGVPKPQMQVPIALGEGRYAYVDALYPVERVVVELDGPGHERPGRRRHDAWRDSRLRDLGHEVLRFDEEWLEDRPAGVARRVLRTLSSRRGAGNLA